MKSKMLLEASKKYLKNGLSVVATDANKRSLLPWKKYQSEQITENDLQEQLSHPKAAGLAIICGAVSGGLEVIDVDLKNDITGTLWSRLFDALHDAKLFDLLKVAKTKSGGYHLYYRCEEIEGNKKLALRPATPPELKDNPQLKQVVIIETRGEAGYVIAPPTDGYEWVSGTLQVLTVDQRGCILEICRSFNEVFEQHIIPVQNRQEAKEYGLSPFEDYNKRGDITALLQSHGWEVVREQGEKIVFKRPGTTDSKSSGDYNTRLGWFSVFTTNSCFEPNKAYRPYAVYAMLECSGDFKEAAKRLLNAGYGERRVSYGVKVEQEVFRRKQDGQDRDAILTYLIKKEDKSSAEAAEILDSLEKQWGEKICTFWDVDGKGRPVINRTKLDKFLSEVGGFYLYFHNQGNIYRFVKMQDGFVEESSTEQVKKFIKGYINTLPDSFDGGISPMELLEVIYKGADSYFSKSFLEFIDRREIDFLRDEDTRAYFPFRNGVVVVEKGKPVTIKSYGDIGKHIWANQVIDFDITIDNDFEATLCEYYRFLNNISGKEEERLNYALSLIGYMLHGWKNPSRPYAPILAEETDDERKGGGTGKGIFTKAISKIIPVVAIDGKNFKIDKNFAFQRVGLDTKLIVIEDCPKNVEFEKFYPTITEGITIEKKNKDELFLPYSESPKIAFTTNYSISQDAEHSRRRQRVFEFASHYSSKLTPEDEFGHKLFDDWDKDEWNRFYNLMFTCVGIYLDAGILQTDNSEKMKRKHIKLAYGEEFLDWWEDYLTGNFKNWNPVTGEYNGFLKSNEFDKKDYSIQRFRRALKESAGSYGYGLETRRNKQNANQSEFQVQVR
jgi:Bifunctional DNA primase/polymerase, N-terminal